MSKTASQLHAIEVAEKQYVDETVKRKKAHMKKMQDLRVELERIEAVDEQPLMFDDIPKKPNNVEQWVTSNSMTRSLNKGLEVQVNVNEKDHEKDHERDYDIDHDELVIEP